MSNAPEGYTCEYCGNVLKRESNFLKHRCKEMVRDEQLRSVRGQSSFRFYSYWLSKKKRGKYNIKTFGQSKYFKTFYDFVDWSKKVKLPDREQYIRFMILKDYPPSMWTSNAVYVQFLDWIDAKWTADDHFRQTFNTLKAISKAAECELSEALLQLHPNEVLVYVRARKLSPWVLLKMQSFKKMYSTLNPEQQLMFEQTIRPIHWGKILKDPAKQDDNELIALAVKQVKL
jgi:hypothetical protein